MGNSDVEWFRKRLSSFATHLWCQGWERTSYTHPSPPPPFTPYDYRRVLYLFYTNNSDCTFQICKKNNVTFTHGSKQSVSHWSKIGGGGTHSGPHLPSLFFILDLKHSEKLGGTFRAHSFLLEILKKVLKNHSFLEKLENLYHSWC